MHYLRSLFRSAIIVCPRSAKLHLQLTKLEVNRGNYAVAEDHISSVKAIDPDFCDVEYQEALLSLLYYNDVDRAIDQLVRNMRCVYSSTGSWTLLSKLWEEKIRAAPNDYKVKEKIGDYSLGVGMFMMAVHQYQASAAMALHQQKMIRALQLSVKAERALGNLTFDVFEENYVMHR